MAKDVDGHEALDLSDVDGRDKHSWSAPVNPSNPVKPALSVAVYLSVNVWSVLLVGVSASWLSWLSNGPSSFAKVIKVLGTGSSEFTPVVRIIADLWMSPSIPLKTKLEGFVENSPAGAFFPAGDNDLE